MFQATYSFVDVLATIEGPGGAFPLGYGSGDAKEGITFEKADKNTMTIGSDGSGMHSMHADESGTITVRMLKTSPVNAQLTGLYLAQKQSSVLWGKNQITMTNIATGDIYTCTGVAFHKYPANTYAEEGNVLEWAFDAIVVDPLLGLAI